MHAEHLVTTEYVLAEARDVIDRKWPEHRDVLEALLAAISYASSLATRTSTRSLWRERGS